MTEVVAGAPAASPIPTPIRASTRCAKLLANPDTAVASDQSAVLMEMMSHLYQWNLLILIVKITTLALSTSR